MESMGMGSVENKGMGSMGKDRRRERLMGRVLDRTGMGRREEASHQIGLQVKEVQEEA